MQAEAGATALSFHLEPLDRWLAGLPRVWSLGEGVVSPVGGALTDAPPRRQLEPEAAAEEVERRSRGCRLQYQRAGVRFLVPFAAHPLDGGRRLTHLLGPDWLLDVSHLVAAHAHVQDPRIASLEGGRILVGREPGVTSIEVSRHRGRQRARLCPLPTGYWCPQTVHG